MVAISSFFTVVLAAAASVSALPAAIVERTTAAPGDVATKFLTVYQNMDFDALAALTTPDYTFSDLAYPLIEGDKARGMFKWFIHDKEKTQMKISFDSVKTVDANTATTNYLCDYFFNGNHVLNHISTTMTIDNGLVASQVDSYSFPAWAEQALGPIVGPLAKDLHATQKVIQVAAEVQLDMFLDTHP